MQISPQSSVLYGLNPSGSGTLKLGFEHVFLGSFEWAIHVETYFGWQV